MKKVKFSHWYFKFPQFRLDETYLLGVSICNLEDLPEYFIDYDTKYVKGLSGGFYPLPEKGKYMILFFFSGSDELWTTIRRWTPRKEKYYKSLIGQRVEIEVLNEKK